MPTAIRSASTLCAALLAACRPIVLVHGTFGSGDNFALAAQLFRCACPTGRSDGGLVSALLP
jgi:hypothetical protein